MSSALLTTVRSATAGPKSHGRNTSHPGLNIQRSGWWFIAPNLAGIVLFTFIPLLAVIFLSFTDWNLVSGVRGIKLVGIRNFTEVFQDPQFGASVVRTVLYAGVSVPLAIVFGLALAIALNRDIPGRGALRSIFFIPYIVNQVAIGMTWLMLMNPSAGVVNQILHSLGMQNAPAWFASSHWALPALILVAIWSEVGYVSLIYLSALQDAPADLYEAAEIDGANTWHRFLTVTWPALVPTTVFLVITELIGKSQTFGLVALLTNGGPGDSSTVVSFYMYQTAFKFYRFGYAAATGMVVFVGVLLLLSIAWATQRRSGRNAS